MSPRLVPTRLEGIVLQPFLFCIQGLQKLRHYNGFCDTDVHPRLHTFLDLRSKTGRGKPDDRRVLLLRIGKRADTPGGLYAADPR